MKTFKTLISEDTDVQGLTETQLLRSAITEELDAVILYEKMAEQTINPDLRKLFLDVAYEEKVHAEEFEEMLERLDPDYEKAEDQAEDEIEDMFGKEEDDKEDDD